MMEKRNGLWRPVAPNIIRGGRTLEGVLGVGVGIKGYITVELIDARTQRVKRKLEFPNLITDAGINFVLGGTGNIGLLLGAFKVGTGTATPAATDTALVNQVAATSESASPGNGVRGIGPANAYWFERTVRTFMENEANGNLTEFATGNQLVGGTIWTRMLFKDGVGTPTAITKTSAEQLRITYEHRMLIPADATQNTFNISGVNYDITTRAVQIDNGRSWGFDGAFGPILQLDGDDVLSLATAFESDVLHNATGNFNPGGESIGASSAVLQGYVNGNFFRERECKWEPNVANFGTGVGSVSVGQGTQVAFQTVFAPKLAKTDTKRLTLMLRYSVARP